jgi:TolB-like protein
MKRFYFLVGILLIVTGCANPEYFFKNDKFLKSEQSRIKQIAVLPFSGETTFRNEVADVFAMQLLNGLKDKEIKIIQPSNAKIVMEEMKISLTLKGDAQFDKETQRLAQLLHADAVIMGEVRSHQTGATMNGFVTVKLIDTKTGGIIAASHRASGLLFAYSVHQCVVAAAENATNDIVSAINELPRE